MLPKGGIHSVEFSVRKLSNYELITHLLLVKVLKLIMSRQQNCFKSNQLVGNHLKVKFIHLNEML